MNNKLNRLTFIFITNLLVKMFTSFKTYTLLPHFCLDTSSTSKNKHHVAAANKTLRLNNCEMIQTINIFYYETLLLMNVTGKKFRLKSEMSSCICLIIKPRSVRFKFKYSMRGENGCVKHVLHLAVTVS